jgi:Rrf2 family protein
MSGILKISEATSLGFHAMMVLARDPKARVSAGEIGELLHASEATLAKVLQRLVKVGLVTSTRGPKGGFLLGKAPQDISLLEIFEAIEGPLISVSCLLHQPVCPGGKCIFGDILTDIHTRLAEHMAKTTLASIKK